MLAITHVPSPWIEHARRTFVEHKDIDYEKAVQQHDAYCRLLEECGVSVNKLRVNCDFPDCAFVEDTAIVLDEVAILASMGPQSRQGEVASIATVLQQHRELRRVKYPATIEGGDVLRSGRTLLVGLSTRTNRLGIEALQRIVGPFGYHIITVPVHGSLHLKTACTALDDETLLINAAWIDVTPLSDFRLVPVVAEEPWAANIASINSNICLHAAHTETATIIQKMGFAVRTVELSEFLKAEAGITCLGILFAAEGLLDDECLSNRVRCSSGSVLEPS